MADIVLAETALEHLAYWSKQDPRTLRRIFELLQAIQREPFSGIGKPEPLKYELSGYWSRRIDDTHRIVCSVQDDAITVISCRYHY